MNRFTFSAALLAFSLTSPGHAKEQPMTFSHDGVKYTYTVRNISEDRRIISGTATPGTDFRLDVAKGLVTGYANGSVVSFRLKDVKVKTASASPASLVVAAR
ncbi:hypothetical protein [Sphingobium nicotianae]|uniref:Uncharacterized protein n=1 Tax=Sphingobium nicotianae TaxID=2782607 RepID=A0A9X1IQU8_9SPHN|nr:hypothetical protein [Sphingobium nicotianae]MBT2186927.1 hypothetical protein [Sphingobium nicotianae]